MRMLKSPQALATVVLLAGLAVIATAWGFQIIGGYVPCELCLEQRVPYYTALPLTIFALLLMARQRFVLSTGLMLMVAAVFAYGAGLGVYQAGAEWGFWLGPTDCGGNVTAPSDAKDLIGALGKVRLVSCTEASWRMFGLSFAGWNAVASAGLAVLALACAFFSYRRRGS
ncbi:disulfide bond formation protein B [Roseibium sp.]|uniref:disulfide bond formation protein B n=1 Tax=Roseibium sp. TaxID=1936156 RepID=UPI003A976003